MADRDRRTQGPGPKPVRKPAASRAAETRRRNRLLLLERIRTRTAREDDAVGVLPALFVQAALPHREVYALGPDGRPLTVPTGRPAPDGTPEINRALATHYQATSGHLTLTVRAGLRPGPTAAHPPVSRGVPFGGLARVLLTHVVTEAKRRDAQTVDLGRTLSDFCERVAVTPSGGKHGRIPYLTDQLLRLATCAVTYEWTERRGRAGHGPPAAPPRRDLHGDNLFIARTYHFWHCAATPGSEEAHGGTIRLADDFWRDVARACVPVDLRKVHFLRAHPTALDLYAWLTRRLDKLDRDAETHVVLNYDQLHGHLGSHYATDADGALTPTGKQEFGRAVRHALRVVRAAWPALYVETPRGRVVVHATGPDVPRA